MSLTFLIVKMALRLARLVSCALLCTSAYASDVDVDERRLADKKGGEIDYSDYSGVLVRKDKAVLQFGEAGDVSLYRTGKKAASFDGSLRMDNGVLQFASTSTACTSSGAGSVKFNPALKRLELCNGTHWASLSSGRRLNSGETSDSTGILTMMKDLMGKMDSMQSSCATSGGAVWVTRNPLPKVPTNTGGSTIRIIMRNDIRVLKYQCVWSAVASHKLKTISTNAKYADKNQWDCPIPKWPNPSESPFALFLKVREMHGGSSDYAKTAFAHVPFAGAQPLDGKVMITAIAPTLKFEQVDFYVKGAETYDVKFSVQDDDHDLLSLKFSSSCSNTKASVVYSTPDKSSPSKKLVTFNFKAAGTNWSPITCKLTLKDDSGLSASKEVKLTRVAPKPQCSHYFNEKGFHGGADLSSSTLKSKRISGGAVNSNFVLKVLIQTGSANFCNSGWRGIFGGGCHTFGLWFNGGLRNERQCGPHPGHSIIPCSKFKASTRYWIQITRVGGAGTMTVYSVNGEYGMGSAVAEKKYNIGYASYPNGIQTLARANTGGEIMTGKVFCFDFKST